MAIERYLRTQFGYTLELPGTLANDPIAEFLFVRKKGHCEYFASAMAVMLAGWEYHPGWSQASMAGNSTI